MLEKRLKRIELSVNNLTDILDEFISNVQLESHGVKVEAAAFNLPEFLGDVILEMDGILCKKNQFIKYQHDGEASIKQSKKILKNILLNLLSNASKYSPENKEIQLTSSGANNHMSITVKDHGIGIPEEDQKNLFTEFFRAGNVENIQGTGLGLSIVKKYIELIDGSISFISKPNEGSAFTINLPQLIADENGPAH